MSWKKTIQDAPAKSWKDSIQNEGSKVSQLESGLRGAAQGASLGFSDELTGLLESLISDKSYEDARDESRANYHEAEEANPGSYLTGNVAGGVATSLIPGLNIAKGASLAGRVGMAATGGGLTGLGLSEADNGSDLALDTASGAVLGGGLQGVGEKVLSPMLKGAGSLMKKGYEKAPKFVGKALANVPEEYTEKYLKNPNVVNKAMSREDLAESLLQRADPDELERNARGFIKTGGGVQQLKEVLSSLDSVAWNELDENQVIKKSDFLDEAMGHIKKSIVNPYDSLSRTKGAGASLDRMAAVEKQMDEIMAAYPEYISEADLKAIVKDLQDVAYSMEGSPKSSLGAEGVRRMSGNLNSSLKGMNAGYEEAMDPVQSTTKLLKSLERNFINKQDPDSYDKFLSQLNRWGSKNESSSAKTGLRELDKLTGNTFSDDIENTLAKESFSKADTNGARKTLAGTMVGGAIGSLAGPLGSLIGGAGGAIAGQAMDKYAGRAFKSMLDGKIGFDSKILPALGKYAGPIGDAMKRGNAALATTHYILMQKDPDYRKMMSDIDGEGQ